jgi:DNA-nicking Smr family endonuclease
MPVKNDQHKVGAKAKPRGQQTGMAGAPDQNRQQKKQTPPLDGGRKNASKMFADKSAQNVGGDSVTPKTASPSTVITKTAKRKGETGGETAFKARLSKKRATKRGR